MDIDDIDFIFISRQSLTRAPPPIRLLKQPRACIPITVAIVLIVMFVGKGTKSVLAVCDSDMVVIVTRGSGSSKIPSLSTEVVPTLDLH